MEKWEKLKLKINEQLEDIRNHRGCSGTWTQCANMYHEVLKVMEAIEHGTEDMLVPNNCKFKTRAQILYEEAFRDKD